MEFAVASSTHFTQTIEIWHANETVNEVSNRRTTIRWKLESAVFQAEPGQWAQLDGGSLPAPSVPNEIKRVMETRFSQTHRPNTSRRLENPLKAH